MEMGAAEFNNETTPAPAGRREKECQTGICRKTNSAKEQTGGPVQNGACLRNTEN